MRAAEHYRQRALECYLIAEGIADPGKRLAMFELAGAGSPSPLTPSTRRETLPRSRGRLTIGARPEGRSRFPASTAALNQNPGLARDRGLGLKAG